MNKQKKTAHTDGIGGRETFRLDIKKGLTKTSFWLTLYEFTKKTARSFVAEIYRSGNAAGDYCKATSWHTQKSA